MNCNQIFIEKLRCPDYQLKNHYVSLNCPPKYSQTFIMNQIINKPRMLRTQYSTQKFSTSIDELNQTFEQPSVVNLTITQLRNIKSAEKTKKCSFNTLSKASTTLQVTNQNIERKRSNTHHINSLAKTALLFVNREGHKRMKTVDYQDYDIDQQTNEQCNNNSSQQSFYPQNFTTTITLPNNKFESTMNSTTSQNDVPISTQIDLVKEYVSEINQYHIKWENSGKLTKNIPKKLLEKYAVCDNTSLYLESSRFKISENFNTIYKQGKYRWLYPGEEAAIIEGINQYLLECQKKLSMLMISLQKILRIIVSQKRLEYLLNYPICLKQIESHWKIMATVFKIKQQYRIYKNQTSNKLWKDVQGSKTLFLDLNQESNKLTKFVKQIFNQ